MLSFIVGGSEWLARRGVFRHIGSALLVIVFGAVASNLGLIPAGSTAEAPVAVYDAIFTHVVPIALFWLLLMVNLRDVLKAGLPLVLLFLVGAAGTTAGAIAGMRAVGGHETVGPLSHAIAGMFAGTYIGGSINFNAVALHYGVMQDGVLYGGSVVVDNIITTIWIAATLAIPRLLRPVWRRRGRVPERRDATDGPIIDLAAERETVDPRRLAIMIALGAGALWISNGVAAWSSARGLAVPSILILTTLALALAQVRAVTRLPGARVLGMYGVYLFLTVIGVFCDLQAFGRLGTLGVVLLAFAAITVAVHGVMIFGAAWLFGMDLDGAAVASQANIGGGTSALALAKSLGREDLLVPAILLGSLGNALGTFLGFLAAGMS